MKLKDYQSAILNFERALEKARLLPSEAAQNGIIAVRGMEEELWERSCYPSWDNPASNATEMQSYSGKEFGNDSRRIW